MKTYRCVEEFWVEDYYVDRLSLWKSEYLDNYSTTELVNDKDVRIYLTKDSLEEYFEEVK